MRRSLYTYTRAAREPSPFLAAAPLFAPFSIPESFPTPIPSGGKRRREREELQVGEMDLLERNIKKGDTTEEEKARKEDERKEEEEVGERKTKTQDQEPQPQGQVLSLSLANGSARYLSLYPHLSETPAPPKSGEGSASVEWFAAVCSIDWNLGSSHLRRAFPPFPVLGGWRALALATPSFRGIVEGPRGMGCGR